MTERLFQFIWQSGYFNKNNLVTAAGEKIQIVFPGNLNLNQGPDFQDAKIRIGKTLWAGSVELHLKTSDWEKHHHQLDKNYKNVILHVVWENDNAAMPAVVPLLELKEQVAKILLDRYDSLMNNQGFIPCENNISSARPIVWKSWKERLIVERLLRKSEIVETYLQQNKTHWEETFWWLLAKNFGMKVNADAFEQMARSIPVNILAKHKNQLQQIEALLFGQAGLLEAEFNEDYPKMLKKEYSYLKKKYQLKKTHQPVYFLRMRPGNFPTIRLAQLAILVTASSHLFSEIREATTVSEIRKWFEVTANDYWHYHYRFDELSEFKKKNLGADMINNIIINTICPVLFAWGNYHDDDLYKTKAINWLEEILPEKNNVTSGFQQLRIENNNACDSQALLELKNEYCKKRRCLDCAVGNALLRP
ncbi:MAG TPA: DUF2851 family protein [Chitinophagaceae bacterium]|nr:DUF2851 family protein [Chitinophagaceae bacterium]